MKVFKMTVCYYLYSLFVHKIIGIFEINKKMTIFAIGKLLLKQ